MIGELPKTMARVTRNARAYRLYLENAVLGKSGQISNADHHWIDEAVSNEVHAAVCRWLLRNKLEEMATTDILACSAGIPKAKYARNRAVAQLELNQKIDPWDNIHNATIPEVPTESTESTQNAPQPEAATETPDTASTSPAATEKTTSDFTVAPIQTGE